MKNVKLMQQLTYRKWVKRKAELCQMKATFTVHKRIDVSGVFVISIESNFSAN